MVTHLPARADLGAPAVLRLLAVYRSAQAMAQAPPDDLARVLEESSERRWSRAQARQALARQALARQAAASPRAVAARAVVGRTLARHLLDLRTRVAELAAARAELLRADPPSPPSPQVPAQVPGWGPLWTATIRAELGASSRFARVDQVGAYAGREPRTHDSGRFAGQRRLSKRGPGALRPALSMAPLVAVRVRPEWRRRYQRLRDRGRAKKEALTIRARTLLKVISHLLRTGASYDPADINPVPLAGQG